MSQRRLFTVLGCASSPGVPRINGDWGACDPENPKNRRTRAAFLIRQIGADGGETTVVVDTGPDFREQMISNKVRSVDAVLYTHAHADHVHGIDDLRGFALSQRQRIPIYADPETMARIRAGFGYCLTTPEGSGYPPIVTANLIQSLDDLIVIEGAGAQLKSRRSTRFTDRNARWDFASAMSPIAAMSATFRRQLSTGFGISTS